MRQIMTISLTVFVFLSFSSAAQSARNNSERNWAAAEIRQVVNAGIMGPSVAKFRPNAILTWGELSEAVLAVSGRIMVINHADRPVKMGVLNKWLVQSVGLKNSANLMQKELQRIGLKPSKRVGTEVMARMAHFRINHEHPNDIREIAPNKPVTRAEAAYSFARILTLTDWELDILKNRARNFSLPALGKWQKKFLKRAITTVGFPYIWGGASARAQAPFGKVVSGGFDCSGLTWYVYKFAPFKGAEKVARKMIGRTTYVMSGEFKRSQRITFNRLKPADLMFFGYSGTRSKPSEVGHVGIYLGGGWMIHSSIYGTTLTPISSYYTERFAWGRRVLREAGLR